MRPGQPRRGSFTKPIAATGRVAACSNRSGLTVLAESDAVTEVPPLMRSKELASPRPSDSLALLTPDEVAALLRLTPSGVRDLLRRHLLPGFRLPPSGRWYVRRAALEEYFAALESAEQKSAVGDPSLEAAEEIATRLLRDLPMPSSGSGK